MTTLGTSTDLSLICPECKRFFPAKCSFRQHIAKFHPSLDISNQKYNQVCGICHRKFVKIKDLQHHIQWVHKKVGLQFQTNIFHCEDDFREWKCDEERKTRSQFVKQRGARKIGDDISVIYFICQHSGLTKMIEDQVHVIKHGGSLKTAVTCPANMTKTMKIVDEVTEIIVEYQSVHMGHKPEVYTLPLSTAEGRDLASMPSEGSTAYKLTSGGQKHCASTNRLVEKTSNGVNSETVTPVSLQDPSLICPVCKLSFSAKCSLKHHILKFHPLIEFSNLKLNQSCGICDMKFGKMKDLQQHIQTRHNVNLQFHTKIFYCEDEFKKWKHDEERDSQSSFIKQGGAHKVKDDTSFIYFHCHRSGSAKIKEDRIRPIKHGGSLKTGITCPANMKKTTTTVNEVTEIIVEYQSVHVGHDLEVSKLSLSTTERRELASKLNQGISVDDIILDVQRHNSSTRLGLVSKQDIRNIRRDFKINSNGKPH